MFFKMVLLGTVNRKVIFKRVTEFQKCHMDADVFIQSCPHVSFRG